MSLFVLDTAGNQNLLQTSAQIKNTHLEKRSLLTEKSGMQLLAATLMSAKTDDEDCEDDGDYYGLPPPSVDLSKIIESALEKTEPRKTQVELEIEAAIERVDMAVKNAHEKKPTISRRKRITDLDYSDFNVLTGKFDEEKLVRTNVEQVMTKAEMGAGFEQLKELPKETKKKQRQLNRMERSKSKGAGWFNLPATEVTEEVENDLKLLQMRSVLDPKHFYKKNDLKVLPKYFQIGTVQHSPLDYYSERDTRKNKKRSLVDELLADADAQKYTKRKYQEVVARRDKYAHRKAMQKMKKLKKNK